MAKPKKSLSRVADDTQIRVPFFIPAGTVKRLDALADEMTAANGIKYSRSDAVRYCIKRALAEVDK